MFASWVHPTSLTIFKWRELFKIYEYVKFALGKRLSASQKHVIKKNILLFFIWPISLQIYPHTSIEPKHGARIFWDPGSQNPATVLVPSLAGYPSSLEIFYMQELCNVSAAGQKLWWDCICQICTNNLIQTFHKYHKVLSQTCAHTINLVLMQLFHD